MEHLHGEPLFLRAIPSATQRCTPLSLSGIGSHTQPTYSYGSTSWMDTLLPGTAIFSQAGACIFATRCAFLLQHDRLPPSSAPQALPARLSLIQFPRSAQHAA